MQIIIDGVKPMGAVRMTRKGKWTDKAAQRYLEYKEYLKWTILKGISTAQKKFEPGEALHVDILFKMPIPESNSKKLKRDLPGTPHMKTPDIDNLVKGVFDSINGILWADDNQVASVAASKVYSTEPGIEIFIKRLEGKKVG